MYDQMSKFCKLRKAIFTVRKKKFDEFEMQNSTNLCERFP